MRKRLVLWLICTACVSIFNAGCVSKNVVVRVSGGKAGELQKEGIFYALPRTVVRVEAPVVRIHEAPGHYKKFAACFFPLEKDRVILSEQTSFKLGAPTFSSRGEPDHEEIYMVKIKGGLLENKALMMEWTDGGVLKKGEAESQDQSVEFITQAVKSVASLGVQAASQGLLTVELVPSQPTTSEQSLLDACKKKDKTLSSEDDQHFSEALKIFNKIQALRAQREGLFNASVLNSTLPADTLQLMLNELDEAIAAYKNIYFMGTTTSQTWTPRFEYTPPKPKDFKQPENDFPLFELSKEHGVCKLLVSDQGHRVPPDFSIGTCGTSTKVSLKLTRLDNQLSTGLAVVFPEQTERKDPSEKGERGFYYRVPAMTLVKLLNDVVEVNRTLLPVAQYGMTASLPASTGGRRTKYSLTLDDASGAMKNFTLGSDALLTKSFVTDLEAAGKTILDNKKAALDNKDEVKQATRLKTLLELCAAIQEKQEKLGQPINLPTYCQPIIQ